MIDYSIMSDEQLVKNIQADTSSSKSLSILIDRHSGLCIEMINQYVSKSYNESLRVELIKDKDYQIYNSALKYNPEKGTKFSTYLGNEVKWKCLNLYNKNKRRKTLAVEENLINFLHHSNNESSDNTSEIFDQIIKYCSESKDERIHKIFNLRYVIGKDNSVMPWKLVSQKMNMSIQGCINIHDAALKNIKYKIKKEV